MLKGPDKLNKTWRCFVDKRELKNKISFCKASARTKWFLPNVLMSINLKLKVKISVKTLVSRVLEMKRRILVTMMMTSRTLMKALFVLVDLKTTDVTQTIREIFKQETKQNLPIKSLSSIDPASPARNIHRMASTSSLTLNSRLCLTRGDLHLSRLALHMTAHRLVKVLGMTWCSHLPITKHLKRTQ